MYWIYILSILAVTVVFAQMIVLILKDLGLWKWSFYKIEAPRLKKVQLSENTKILLKIAALCLLTRALILICGVVGNLVIDSYPFEFEKACQVWGRMDGYRYLDIAQYGYIGEGEYNRVINIAFYPLYPFIVRLFSYLLRPFCELQTAIAASAVIVSNLLFIFAVFIFYRLMRMDYGEKQCFCALKYLIIFPFSFFYAITYTESLFLLLSVLVFYFARKRKWTWCGIIGALASFSRPQGILLIIPVLYEYYINMALPKFRLREFFQSLRWSVIWIFLMPMGFIGYLIINKVVSGSFFGYLVHQKEYWNQQFGFFARNIANMFNQIMHGGNFAESAICWIPQIIVFFLSLVLLAFSYKKMRNSYFIYTFFYLFVSFSPTALISIPRYVMTAFPLYFRVGNLYKYKYLDLLISFVCIFLLCFFALLFTRERYVY